ncbi:hypothetical protein Tco_0268147 [Tanacetum coccineum]
MTHSIIDFLNVKLWDFIASSLFRAVEYISGVYDVDGDFIRGVRCNREIDGRIYFSCPPKVLVSLNSFISNADVESLMKVQLGRVYLIWDAYQFSTYKKFAKSVLGCGRSTNTIRRNVRLLPTKSHDFGFGDSYAGRVVSASCSAEVLAM